MYRRRTVVKWLVLSCLLYVTIVRLAKEFNGAKTRLTYDSRHFYIDGKRTRLMTGSIHYFRVPRHHWRHRLEMMKEAGLNGITTYVPWNMHEPYPGQFDFDGDLDLVAFVQLAAELDLHVLLRPGPYICSEWDWGGLPFWLLRDESMVVRSQHPAYVRAVKRYFAVLLPLVVPLQATHGGPIIAVQVENEYGMYFGAQSDHLLFLRDVLKENGIVEPLFTSDGASVLKNGERAQLSDELISMNFKSSAESNLRLFARLFPTQPIWIMEYWAGWFDWWGEGRNLFDDDDFEAGFKAIHDSGGSVNFYMFHGGTNFGFTNGALYIARNYYTADVTSYDYDCPISEHGNLTRKYYMIKNVLNPVKDNSALIVPKPAKYPSLSSVASIGWFSSKLKWLMINYS